VRDGGVQSLDRKAAADDEFGVCECVGEFWRGGGAVVYGVGGRGGGDLGAGMFGWLLVLKGLMREGSIRFV